MSFEPKHDRDIATLPFLLWKFNVSKPTDRTHLENSVNEAKYLLRKMHVEKETYVPGKYSWSPAGKDELRWQTIPRQSVISVYKHYFADFGKNFQLF